MFVTLSVLEVTLDHSSVLLFDFFEIFNSHNCARGATVNQQRKFVNLSLVVHCPSPGLPLVISEEDVLAGGRGGVLDSSLRVTSTGVLVTRIDPFRLGIVWVVEHLEEVLQRLELV